MSRITKISQQKNKNRVNVYLDNEFAFGLDLENFVRLGLKIDQELGDNDVKKIVAEGEYAKNFEKLLNFAMLRPRSYREILDWFKRKKVHDSLHKKLINKLEKLDLLDDALFAKWWVGQRLEFRPRSKRALFSELLKKGIDKNIIKQTLEEIDVDEVSLASRELKKRNTKWAKYSEDYERKQKQMEYLARKGYSWDVVKKVVEKTKG